MTKKYESENSDTITNAVELLTKINEDKVVTIQFVKQNGEVRIMKATLDFNSIDELKHPKNPLDLARILKHIDKNNVLRVFDLEKQEWRSVPFNRIHYVETKNKVYKVMSTINNER